MNPVEIHAKIMAVVRELDKVEVRGRANMKIVTVCQDYLENMANELKAAQDNKESEE